MRFENGKKRKEPATDNGDEYRSWTREAPIFPLSPNGFSSHNTRQNQPNSLVFLITLSLYYRMLTTSGYPNGASLRSSIDDSPQDQDESETFLLGMVTGDGLGKVSQGRWRAALWIASNWEGSDMKSTLWNIVFRVLTFDLKIWAGY